MFHLFFGKFEKGCMRNLLALFFVLLFIIDLSDGEIGAVCKKFPSSHCPSHNFLIKHDVKHSLPILSAPVLATGTQQSPCLKSVYFPFKPCPILPATPEIVFQGAGCGGLPA
jgi:hypothetical protein